jgi:hypothetical protein
VARSIPVRPPLPMTAAEYRQHCHDIINSHRPARTWCTLWLLRRCSGCGKPWIELDGALSVDGTPITVVGCWLVRGAVAQLAAQRPDAGRPWVGGWTGLLQEDTTMPLDRWRQR